MPRFAILVFLGLLFVLSPAPLRAYDKVQTVLPPPPGNFTEERLEQLERAITDTGMTPDAIPPIENPLFISIENAMLAFDPNDHMFLLDSVSPPRLYPQLTLVWHSVVNEMEGAGNDAVRRSIIYCPLTGTMAAFSGRIDGHNTSFGTHGGLLNNNTLLYDRATGTTWTPLGGLGIAGPYKGKRLQPTPLVWTTFERAAAKYPHALVLSRATGHRRTYNKDPYGSYARNGTYYHNQRIVHPLQHRDDRLPPKTPVLGVITPQMVVAVVLAPLERAGVANFDAGPTPVVSFWDDALAAPRLFDRRMDGEALTFAKLDGEFYDNATKTRWSAEGVAQQGRYAGRALTRLATFHTMWFAWAAFFPETRLYNWSPELEEQAKESFREYLPDKLKELLFPEQGGM